VRVHPVHLEKDGRAKGGVGGGGGKLAGKSEGDRMGFNYRRNIESGRSRKGAEVP